MAEIHRLAERLLALNQEAPSILEALNQCRSILGNGARSSHGPGRGSAAAANGVPLGPALHESVGVFHLKTRARPSIITNTQLHGLFKQLWRKFPAVDAINNKSTGYQTFASNAASLYAEIEPFYNIFAASIEFVDRALILLLQAPRLIGLSFELAPDLCDQLLTLLCNWVFVHRMFVAVPLNEKRGLLAAFAALHEIRFQGEREPRFANIVRFLKDHEKNAWAFMQEQLRPAAPVVLALLPRVKADMDAHLLTSGAQIRLSKVLNLSTAVNGPSSFSNVPEAVRAYVRVCQLPAIAIAAFLCFPSDTSREPLLMEMVQRACAWGWIVPITGDAGLSIWEAAAGALKTLQKPQEIKRQLREALQAAAEHAPAQHRERRDVLHFYLKQAAVMAADADSMIERSTVLASTVQRASAELVWYFMHYATAWDAADSLNGSAVVSAAAVPRMGDSAAGSGSIAAGRDNGGGNGGVASSASGVLNTSAGGMSGATAGGLGAVNAAMPAALAVRLPGGRLFGLGDGLDGSGGAAGSGGAGGGSAGAVTFAEDGGSGASGAAGGSDSAASDPSRVPVVLDLSILQLVSAMHGACMALKQNSAVLDRAHAAFYAQAGPALSSLMDAVLRERMDDINVALLRDMQRQLAGNAAACGPLYLTWLRYQLCLVLPTLAVTRSAAFSNGFLTAMSTFCHFEHTVVRPCLLGGALAWFDGSLYRIFRSFLHGFYHHVVESCCKPLHAELLQAATASSLHLLQHVGLVHRLGTASMRTTWFPLTAPTPTSATALGQMSGGGGISQHNTSLLQSTSPSTSPAVASQTAGASVGSPPVAGHGLAKGANNPALSLEHPGQRLVTPELAHAIQMSLELAEFLLRSFSRFAAHLAHVYALQKTLLAPRQAVNPAQTRFAHQLLSMVRGLALGMASVVRLEIHALEFLPLMYLRNAILSRVFEHANMLAFYSDEALSGPVAEDGVTLEDLQLLSVQRPSAFVHDLFGYLRAFGAVGDWVHIDMATLWEQLFHDMLEPAVIEKYVQRLETGAFAYRPAQATRSRQQKERRKPVNKRQPFAVTYAVWLVQFALHKVASGEAIYSFSERRFVSRSPSASLQVARYLDRQELLALCAVTGPKGLVFLDMKLTQLMCTLVANLRQHLAANLALYSLIAQNCSAASVLDALRRIRGVRELVPQALLLGALSYLRGLLYDAAATTARASAEHVSDFVSNVHERYPAGGFDKPELKDLDFLANSVGRIDRIDTSMQEAITSSFYDPDAEPALNESLANAIPTLFAVLTLAAAADDGAAYVAHLDALDNNAHCIAAAFSVTAKNLRLVNPMVRQSVGISLMHQQYLVSTVALLHHVGTRPESKGASEYSRPELAWVVVRHFMDLCDVVAPHDLEQIVPYSLVVGRLPRSRPFI